MNAKSVHLILNISAGADADASELDLLTRHLRSEIQELDVESVDLLRDKPAPTGAKAVDPVTLGALAVAVLPAVVPKLVEFLQSWTLRKENRTVKIKTQIGDQSLEIEYSPKLMSQTELMTVVDTLTAKLRGRN
jgi:hypothetical protein